MNNPTINISHTNIRSLAFSPDGTRLWTAGLSGSGTNIRRWRVSDGQEDINPIPAGNDVSALVASQDGRWIVSTVGGVATLRSTGTPRVSHQLTGHSEAAAGLDLSSDSSRLATGSNDQTVLIRDISDMSNIRRIGGALQHADWVRSVRFSPDGQRLATGTGNAVGLRIYNARTGHSNPLRTFSFSVGTSSTPIAWSSSRTLFALSVNMIVHVDVEAGEVLATWMLPSSTVGYLGSIGLSANGRFLACNVGNFVSLRDASTSARIVSDITPPSQPWSVAVSLDSRCLAIGHAGGVILRNLNTLISDNYLAVRPPPVGGPNIRQQVEALRGDLLSLGSRIDESRCRCTTNPPDLQAQIIPLRISSTFIYRIKSSTQGPSVYLTRTQSGVGPVVAQTLDPSSEVQGWTVALVAPANEVYNIGATNVSLTVGARNALVTSGRGATWIFEPRGNAYVIGNSVNVTAIQLAPNRQNVAVAPRSGSPNQRWILEPVTN